MRMQVLMRCVLRIGNPQLKRMVVCPGLMVGNMAPEVPHWCEPEWRGLMEACWEVNPSSRPAFRTLAGQLEKIIEAAPAI